MHLNSNYSFCLSCTVSVMQECPSVRVCINVNNSICVDLADYSSAVQLQASNCCRWWKNLFGLHVAENKYLCCRLYRWSTDLFFICFKSAGKKMLQMIHSLHLHRLKTDHADNKLVCNLSVLGKTDLLQICCRSAGFVRVTMLCTAQLVAFQFGETAGLHSRLPLFSDTKTFI